MARGLRLRVEFRRAFKIDDGRRSVFDDFRRVDVDVQEKVDVLFRVDKRETVRVLIMVGVARVAAPMRSHEVREVAEVRVRPHIDFAVEMHAHFRTAVAA